MAWLEVSGLRGKGMMTLLLAPLRLIKALYQSVKIMRKHKPSVVLGMGGFVAGPGGLVAALMGIPLLIHEQNAVPGLTNKLLSKFSRKVLEGFAGSFTSAAKKAVSVGNPVRLDIAELAMPTVRREQRADKEQIRVLVVGGSLGAQALNETVPAALEKLDGSVSLTVRHQAGRDKDTVTQEAYNSVGVDGVITAFIEDMAEAYAWADLVICRAGALTIAELAAAGVASILVPYPHAVDDHQTANGLYLSESGAALLIPQSELTPEILAGHLRELLEAPERLLSMGIKARELAKPDATAEVAAWVARVGNFEFSTEAAL